MADLQHTYSLVQLIFLLAQHLQVDPESQAWSQDIDADWRILVNPTKSKQRLADHTILPNCTYIQHSGMLVGLLVQDGREFLPEGQNINGRNFRNALLRRLAQAEREAGHEQ